MSKKDDATQKVSEEALGRIRQTAQDISRAEAEPTQRASEEDLRALQSRAGGLDEGTPPADGRMDAARLKDSIFDAVETLDPVRSTGSTSAVEGESPPPGDEIARAESAPQAPAADRDEPVVRRAKGASRNAPPSDELGRAESNAPAAMPLADGEDDDGVALHVSRGSLPYLAVGALLVLLLIVVGMALAY